MSAVFIECPNYNRKTTSLTIALYDSYALPADPEVRAAIEATARLCESMGHEVIETKQPVKVRVYEKNYIALFARSALAARRAIEEATGKPIAESGLMNRYTVEFGNKAEGLSADDFEAANNFFLELEQKFNSWITPFDVVLSPKTYAPPPRLGFLVDDSKDYAEMSRRVFDFVSFTSPQNVFGLPAMSVPLHMSPAGLPIGSHFFAKYGLEPMLLELAYELEAAQP